MEVVGRLISSRPEAYFPIFLPTLALLSQGGIFNNAGHDMGTKAVQPDEAKCGGFESRILSELVQMQPIGWDKARDGRPKPPSLACYGPERNVVLKVLRLELLRILSVSTNEISNALITEMVKCLRLDLKDQPKSLSQLKSEGRMLFDSGAFQVSHILRDLSVCCNVSGKPLVRDSTLHEANSIDAVTERRDMDPPVPQVFSHLFPSAKECNDTLSTKPSPDGPTYMIEPLSK